MKLETSFTRKLWFKQIISILSDPIRKKYFSIASEYYLLRQRSQETFTLPMPSFELGPAFIPLAMWLLQFVFNISLSICMSTLFGTEPFDWRLLMIKDFRKALDPSQSKGGCTDKQVVWMLDRQKPDRTCSYHNTLQKLMKRS